MNKEEGAGLKIRIFGDPLLRKKTRQVKRITSFHRETLSNMARTMYESSGIGLATPQVGISESMIVVDIGGGLYKLINPRIVNKQGSQIMEEGCLSVPGVCIKVKRAKRVVVEAEDEDSQPVTIKAEDLLARVFQHEIDHLKGRLIVDYASFFERLNLRKNLAKLKEKTKDEGLPESKRESCKLQL